MAATSESSLEQQKNSLMSEAVKLMKEHLLETCPALPVYDLSELTEKRKIAAGNGRTTVYEFTLKDRHTNKYTTVAGKKLTSDHPEFIQNVNLLAREAASVHKLDHSFVGKVEGLAYGDNPPSATLLLDYVAGGTLRKMILQSMGTPYRTAYTYKDAHRWAAQIAEALVYIHSLEPPLMHRDLNPFNIMLTHTAASKADAKLVDFGLHTYLPHKPTPGAGTGTGTADVPKLTQEVGAYMYMAPEVLQGRAYDESADIFSLGCVLYELYYGGIRSAELFRDASSQDKLEEYAHKVADGFRPPMSDKWPVELCLLLQRCMHADPATRPTAKAVVKLLVELEHAGCIAAMDVEKSARTASWCTIS